ncbi:glycosyltransferase family A protein [soil metagenome]
MAPQFTVVVATYDRPALLRQALDSIADQTVRDFECIVVDDGSFSAAPVLPEDDRFRLIELPSNQGLPHAWNLGATEASGAALTFLDDDDLWTPGRLEHAVQGLKRADVAICGARWIHERAARPTRHLEGFVHDTILDAFTPNMGRTAIRRSVKLPFDERYLASQDVEWWIRQSAVSEVATIDEIGHLSRSHGRKRNGNGIEARAASGERMLEDHAGYFATHRTARAFRQYRIGMFHLELRNRTTARRWLARSLRSGPTRRAAWALANSVRAKWP